MKVEIKKESVIELENLARYICCIIDKKDGKDIIKKIRAGRKALCNALEIEYNVKNEISE